jgi:DNA-binding HxlR family transcriptional regulator
MSEQLPPTLFHNCDDTPTPIRVGDKWTAKILVCLQDGPRRFSELQVPLSMVTPKVLTESLRAMERDGLVRRTSYPEVPPRVEYSLTELGRKLHDFMGTVCDWTAMNLSEVRDARRAYAEREPAAPSARGGGVRH